MGAYFELPSTLKGWTDVDVAQYQVARAIGILRPMTTFQEAKGTFWTANPVCDSVYEILEEMVKCGRIEKREEPDLQFRWNPSFVDPAPPPPPPIQNYDPIFDVGDLVYHPRRSWWSLWLWPRLIVGKVTERSNPYGNGEPCLCWLYKVDGIDKWCTEGYLLDHNPKARRPV